ncbi:hypothetical protein Ancab_028426, partial [Ancistrocladus abbreviatus]
MASEWGNQENNPDQELSSENLQGTSNIEDEGGDRQSGGRRNEEADFGTRQRMKN